MCEKTQFLEKLAELFLENGAKTFTMDDIAKAFSVSKKTLYQNYKNKEALLQEVLAFLLKKLIVELKDYENKDLNPIERMLLREPEIESISETNRTVFIRQLIKYYPNIYNQHIIDINNAVSEILVANIEKGRAQGLYKKEFDALVYAKYLLELMFAYDRSPLFEDEQELSRREYCEGVIQFYLNAIVTPKGFEILNQIKEKNKNKK